MKLIEKVDEAKEQALKLLESVYNDFISDESYPVDLTASEFEDERLSISDVFYKSEKNGHTFYYSVTIEYDIESSEITYFVKSDHIYMEFSVYKSILDMCKEFSKSYDDFVSLPKVIEIERLNEISLYAIDSETK